MFSRTGWMWPHPGEGVRCRSGVSYAISDFPDPKMRQHVGGHIFKDKALQASTTVCGFCGAFGCRTTIIEKRGLRHAYVQSTCLSAPRKEARGEAVSLNLKSARDGSRTSPCTNMVFKCLFCSLDNFLWKYGMADHVNRCHQDFTLLAEGTARAREFRKAYTVSSSEKTAVILKLKVGLLRRVVNSNQLLPPSELSGVEGNGNDKEEKKNHSGSGSDSDSDDSDGDGDRDGDGDGDGGEEDEQGDEEEEENEEEEGDEEEEEEMERASEKRREKAVVRTSKRGRTLTKNCRLLDLGV